MNNILKYILIGVGVVVVLFVLLVMFVDTDLDEEVENQDAGSLDPYSTDNLHFDHMPVTYFISNDGTEESRDCKDSEVDRITRAFAIFGNVTDGAVRFVEGGENADINVHCYNTKQDGTTRISGEGGYSFIDNVIVEGDVFMYSYFACGKYPSTEVHEILHVLGYGHVEDKKSIMYSDSTYCDLLKPREIDDWIVEELKDTYSLEG